MCLIFPFFELPLFNHFLIIDEFFLEIVNMIHTYACILKKNCLNIIGKGEVKNVINCIKHTVKEINFKNSF